MKILHIITHVPTYRSWKPLIGVTHSREVEMFCSMMSWSPSLSGRILTEKQPLGSMLPMAVTLTLSPSLTSSEQSAIRQTVACWSVAIGETNPQDVFPGRAGNGRGGGGGGGVGPHPPLVAVACSYSRCRLSIFTLRSHTVSKLENKAYMYMYMYIYMTQNMSN